MSPASSEDTPAAPKAVLPRAIVSTSRRFPYRSQFSYRISDFRRMMRFPGTSNQSIFMACRLGSPANGFDQADPGDLTGRYSCQKQYETDGGQGGRHSLHAQFRFR